MSSEDVDNPAASAPSSGDGGSGSRVEWVLDETLRSRRFVAAMVVGPNGWAVANRGFEHPDRITALAPESIQLLGRLKEAFPSGESPAGRDPGEAASFAGYGEPGREERLPEYAAVSLGPERKLLFRPIEVQGKHMTLVLLTKGLSTSTDSVIEGIGRAVVTCLATDWSRVPES